MSMLAHNNATIIPPEREIITVYKDNIEDCCYCNQFGLVNGWHPSEQASHRHGHNRPCVHRFEPMPPAVLLSADWVAHLHWQMHIANNVMAARTSDVLTMAFDVIGPVLGCKNRPHGRKPENRWQYRLYHMRWWDEDDYSDRVVLGVRAD
jgi:hypothetical protein